jgi:hypothetical protein
VSASSPSAPRLRAADIKTPSDARAYNLAAKGHTVYGSMVCECPTPEADPRRDFGMCQRCGRKPLALFGVKP